MQKSEKTIKIDEEDEEQYDTTEEEIQKSTILNRSKGISKEKTKKQQPIKGLPFTNDQFFKIMSESRKGGFENLPLFNGYGIWKSQQQKKPGQDEAVGLTMKYFPPDQEGNLSSYPIFSLLFMFDYKKKIWRPAQNIRNFCNEISEQDSLAIFNHIKADI